jgi:uncharacterized membrane protein
MYAKVLFETMLVAIVALLVALINFVGNYVHDVQWSGNKYNPDYNLDQSQIKVVQ